MNKKRSKLSLIVILLILFISIGYAFLSTVLNINTSLVLSKVSFSIHFDNVVSLSNNDTDIAQISNEAMNEITISATLNDLGDSFKFTTDIVNDSKVPGQLKTIDLTGLTDIQKKMIKYNIYYTNNHKEVSVGDVLKQGKTKNITVEIKYVLDNSLTNDDMPDDDLPLNCAIVIEYDSADPNSISEPIPYQISEDVTFVSTSLLDFKRPTSSSEHEGLQRLDGTENDEYPIYFYRGGNDAIHNHLIFANKCWRIIRTTSTGGTKIIYNGTPNTNGQCMNLTGDNTHIGGKAYGGNSWYWDSSNMKVELTNWFADNLVSYQDYLDDERFCNTDSTYDFGKIVLNCDDEHAVTVANGRNDYPIGLITADEGNMCGLASYSNSSSYPWLRTEYYYWTMSGISSSGMWIIHSVGALDNGGSSYNSGQGYGIRPVVSLNNEVTIASGYGTQENPYKVELT